MGASYNTKAIILSRQDYREYDSLAVFYTLEFGKKTLIVRGTKKSASKLVGHLEPLNFIDLMIINGRGIGYAAGLIARETYDNLKKDLNGLYYAGLAVSWFKRLIGDEEPDEAIFLLLVNYLQELDRYETSKISKEQGEVLFSFFIFKLLVITGYQPQTKKCLECQQIIKPSKHYFNLQQGGLVCDDCFHKIEDSPKREFLLISENCLKLLRFILDNDLELSKRLAIDKKLSKEIFKLVQDFLNFRI